MKNKHTTFIVVVILISSLLAFIYLNFCGLPTDFNEANTNLMNTDLSDSDYSSMADVKLVQFIVEKMVLIFTTL